MMLVIVLLSAGLLGSEQTVQLPLKQDALAFAVIGDSFSADGRVTRIVGRKVNPTAYTAAEFSKRARTENAFVTRVLEQPKLRVIGSERDVPVPLERLAGPGNVPAKEAPDARSLRAIAAHALSVWRRSGTTDSGHRNGNVFQVLPDTLGLGPEVWRVLSKCHDLRNRTEYEGAIDVDDRLGSDLIGACRKVAAKVRRLPSIPEASK